MPPNMRYMKRFVLLVLVLRRTGASPKSTLGPIMFSTDYVKRLWTKQVVAKVCSYLLLLSLKTRHQIDDDCTSKDFTIVCNTSV
jgi:hypothetical protein